MTEKEYYPRIGIHDGKPGMNRNIISRFFKLFDWGLVISMSLLIIIGFFAVYSAASRLGQPGIFYARQVLAVVIGIAGFFFFIFINYRIFHQYAGAVYVLSVVLLIGVLIWGDSIRGSRSWYNFRLFSFQPVELAKIFMVLVIAAYLDKSWNQIRNFKVILVPIVLIFVHIGLILLQPDFSSSLVYFPVVLGMLFMAGALVTHLAVFIIFGGVMAGVPLIHTFLKLQPALLSAHPFLNFLCKAMEGGLPSLIVLSSICGMILLFWWLLSKFRIFIPLVYPLVLIGLIIGASIGSSFFQRGIKEYQRKRLVVFLNPAIDPLGAGYNITQSAVAIGSGRLLGKGYLSGTQSRLGFLPEQHTDFIFSVIGEEFGFFFSMMVVIIYLIFIWRAFRISMESRDRFGTLVAGGIACMFAFYSIINMGMVVGIMPVTGLPLPFISYGGSSLVTSLMAVGILSSIHVRRYTH